MAEPSNTSQNNPQTINGRNPDLYKNPPLEGPKELTPEMIKAVAEKVYQRLLRDVRIASERLGR
jgi:hypothetical protein